MNIESIPLARLAFAFIPGVAVIALMWRFRAGHQKALYAFLWMFVQLLMISYALIYIFASNLCLVVSAILAVIITSLQLDSSQHHQNWRAWRR